MMRHRHEDDGACTGSQYVLGFKSAINATPRLCESGCELAIPKTRWLRIYEMSKRPRLGMCPYWFSRKPCGAYTTTQWSICGSSEP